MVVIGAVGFYASGKTDLGRYLASKGFVFTSLSDVIRNDLRQKGVELTRENLIARGNELRETKGHDILAQMLIESMDLSKDYFVDSFRHREEVFAFRKIPSFELWMLDAPIELRFSRLLARNRENDPKTIEALRVKELSECSAIGTPYLQVDKVQSLADKIISNTESLESFFAKADQMVADLKLRHQEKA